MNEIVQTPGRVWPVPSFGLTPVEAAYCRVRSEYLAAYLTWLRATRLSDEDIDDEVTCITSAVRQLRELIKMEPGQ